MELGGRVPGGPEGGSRWNPGKDLSFVPLRPERVVEVRYDYLEGARFRHPPQFVRWRPDRDPASCGYAQLDQAGAVRPRRRPRRPVRLLEASLRVDEDVVDAHARARLVVLDAESDREQPPAAAA